MSWKKKVIHFLTIARIIARMIPPGLDFIYTTCSGDRGLDFIYSDSTQIFRVAGVWILIILSTQIVGVVLNHLIEKWGDDLHKLLFGDFQMRTLSLDDFGNLWLHFLIDT